MRQEDPRAYTPKPGELWHWDPAKRVWFVVETEYSLAVKRLEEIRQAYYVFCESQVQGYGSIEAEAQRVLEKVIYEPLDRAS